MKMCEYCEAQPVAYPERANSRFCSPTCRRNGVFGAIDDDAIVKLYIGDGLGLVKTAERYGCGWKAVVGALRRKGHTTRPKSGERKRA